MHSKGISWTTSKHQMTFSIIKAIYLGTNNHILHSTLISIKIGLIEKVDPKRRFEQTLEVMVDPRFLTTDLYIGKKIDIYELIEPIPLVQDFYLAKLSTQPNQKAYEQFMLQQTKLRRAMILNTLDLRPTTNISSSQLKAFRRFVGLSLKDFAKKIHISDKTLSYYESGELDINQSLIDNINANFSIDHLKMEVWFDYVTVTFTQLKAPEVIDKILKMDISLFEEKTTGQNHYTRVFRYAGQNNIYMQDFYEPEKYGATVFLSGEGTRLYESILVRQESTWKRFFSNAIRHQAHFTRIDVAFNDYDNLLPVSELHSRVLSGHYWTKFRSDPDVYGMRNTGLGLKFGKSELIIRIYDKYREQLAKGHQTDIKNRIEIVFKADRANRLVEEYLLNDNLVGFSLDTINTYLLFTDEIPNFEDVDKSVVYNSWAVFILAGQTVKFNTKPKDLSMQRSLEWIEKSVAPTLKLLQEAGLYGEVNSMVSRAELSDQQKNLLKAFNAQQNKK